MPKTIDDILWGGDPAKIAAAEQAAAVLYATYPDGLPARCELSAVPGDHKALIRRASRGRRAR
jgi:hypothetical protein